MVNDSQSCIRPWSTMVNHGHLEAYRPWNDHHLTMVITWLMMVIVLLTDHGQPWLTMVNILDLTTIDHHTTMTIDHGRPWSTMVIWRLIDHEMTIIWPWSLHGWWWLWYYWLTMVNHGWPLSVYRIWLPLTIIWSWLLTMVDHGQPWSFGGLSTMKWPSFDHGHYMVDDGHGTTDWPWSTMVDHGQYIGFDYHWPSYDHDYWPWSTMVMTIVPFYKHGRPWSDHGQLMVISWSTMVNDHDRPWSNHGRPWSDHDPVARAIRPILHDSLFDVQISDLSVLPVNIWCQKTFKFSECSNFDRYNK